MLTRKKNCEVAIHFNNTPHLITDFSFICIEAVSGDHSKQKIGSIYLSVRHFGMHNFLHCNLTVLTKDKNIDLNVLILIEVGISLYQI